MRTRDDSLRLLGGAALLGALMLEATTAAAGSGRLLVFLHVAIKQRALQSELQAALEGITVTAVGRIGDLERSLKEGQDAILSLPAVLVAQGLTPKLQGKRQSATDETYSLVGVGSPPNPSTVSTVGALDLFGREGTTAFVQDLVGGHPKVERVTKFEDLLPLLQYQTVQAILLPTRFFPDLKAVSQLDLAAQVLGKRVGLPAIASIGPAGADVLAALSRLPANAMTAIGVDSWR